jgi:hypothetical protein
VDGNSPKKFNICFLEFIPGKSFTTPVHYEVPSYYIPQVLSEMKALNVMKTLYISHTTESTTVFMIKHSESKAPMKTSATVKVLHSEQPFRYHLD